jgi:2-methylcitrate dehydratase PrpD
LVAGSRDREIDLVDRELGSTHGALASLIPSGARRSIETAALVNGVAAHVLDYDDVGLDGHPRAVLVPAIIAQGEVSGASGAEMLAAYIAGYEVWAELLAHEPTPLHRKGWHPTTVLGTIAAAINALAGRIDKARKLVCAFVN